MNTGSVYYGQQLSQHTRSKTRTNHEGYKKDCDQHSKRKGDTAVLDFTRHGAKGVPASVAPEHCVQEEPPVNAVQGRRLSPGRATEMVPLKYELGEEGQEYADGDGGRYSAYPPKPAQVDKQGCSYLILEQRLTLTTG